MSAAVQWVAPHPHPSCSVPGIDRPLIRHSGGCAFRVVVDGAIEGYYRMAMEASAVARQLGGRTQCCGPWNRHQWGPL